MKPPFNVPQKVGFIPRRQPPEDRSRQKASLQSTRVTQQMVKATT